MIASVLASVLSYFIADRIRFAIDNYKSISSAKFVLTLVLIVFAKELIGYLLRRYSEGFVIKFKDHIRVKLFYDLMGKMSFFDNDASEFKSAMDEYLSTCYYLSSQFVLSLPGKITGIVISFLVISRMGVVPVLINIIALIIFFVISYFFSRSYVEISKVYSEKLIKMETVLTNLFLSIDYMARNKPKQLYHIDAQTEKWNVYQQVKNLHGARWFWQLLPFNIIYVISLGFLINRIQLGENSLGDLALAQWYYSVLLGTFVFVTETVTDLTKQKSSSIIAYNKLKELAFHQPRESVINIPDNIPPGKYLIKGKNGVGKTTAIYDFVSRNRERTCSYLSGEKYPVDYELSSGEIQRMMVLQTSKQDKTHYIFDEPCSHTDETDWFIDVLESISDNKVTIVVSHKHINYDFDMLQ